MPMDQLWTDSEILPAQRKEYLITTQIIDLLRKGPIQFVIANCGDKLVWMPFNTCYDFFKSEFKAHLVENPDRIYLNEYKDEYATWDKEWVLFITSFPYLCRKFHRPMLRQCIAFFLLLAFLASTFSKAFIVVDFYANQDYIAKTLCENRDKPMMHCCGRCQLRKRLVHEDNQDKSNPERRAENKQEVFFCDDHVKAPVVPIPLCSSQSYKPYLSASPIDRAAGIFHPPA